MINYNHNFGSTFPISAPEFIQKKDIDDNVKSMIEIYYNFINNGDISGAAQYYQNNKNLLEQYIIDCAFFNKMSEELYNMGVYILYYRQNIISETEPDIQMKNGNWFQLY